MLLNIIKEFKLNHFYLIVIRVLVDNFVLNLIFCLLFIRGPVDELKWFDLNNNVKEVIGYIRSTVHIILSHSNIQQILTFFYLSASHTSVTTHIFTKSKVTQFTFLNSQVFIKSDWFDSIAFPLIRRVVESRTCEIDRVTRISRISRVSRNFRVSRISRTFPRY